MVAQCVTWCFTKYSCLRIDPHIFDFNSVHKYMHFIFIMQINSEFFYTLIFFCVEKWCLVFNLEMLFMWVQYRCTVRVTPLFYFDKFPVMRAGLIFGV